MGIRVQVAGAWVDIQPGRFRVRNPALATDWIVAAKVRVCWPNGPGGTNQWIDSGYLGVPNAPEIHNKSWSYTSMTTSWVAPAYNGVPITGYRLTVVQQPSGPTRTFNVGPTVLEQTYSVAHDTKYEVSIQALGDTGVPGTAALMHPWIGHPKVSTFATSTQWKPWTSDVKYFSKGPPDTCIYRNEVEGIWIPSGVRAQRLYVQLSGKTPWTPEDGDIINTTTRTAQYIVAGASYGAIPVWHSDTWSELVTLGPQTTTGTYGIRLTGSDWSTLGGTKALIGFMRAYGEESYIQTVETVTTTEQVNRYW
jgi:hypothetical protein